MNGMINKEIFTSSINENDNSYQKFSGNHLPIYKEFYVESTDDAEFYGFYLAKIYRVPKLTKFHGCNGKEEVLREYTKYNGKKAGFIVDLDYLPMNKSKYEKVIVTPGYSMENFFFYNDGKDYNFKFLFNEYYKNYNRRKIKIEAYLGELQKYKENYLHYYAFFKTCMEFSNNNGVSKKHLQIKDIIESDYNIEEDIELEISSFNSILQKMFRTKYEKNIELLKKTDCMMIRGHDIFDHLIEFLKKDFTFIKKSHVLKLAYDMNMPDDFKNQILQCDVEQKI